MADKVSILDKDGLVTYYSTYGAARAAIISLSIEHPLIQIWATLTNEQIILLNGVDIWIAPGVTIDYLPPSLTTAAPTITDNGVECHCQIYGTGVIKNTFVGTTGNVYECIKITNVDTELEINCDYIEGVGKVSDGFAGVSIRIENGEKFHLTCNKVYNQNNVAMYIGSSNLINDINFIIEKVETGIPNTTTTGATAIITRGNGFIDINEILCKSLGHCLSHRAGTVTARIQNLTTHFNRTDSQGNKASTINISQGSTIQKLILYFDEILALRGEISTSDAIQVTQGTGIFIGRKILSFDASAIQILGVNTKGFLKCNQIISQTTTALVVNNFTNQIIIDCDYIEGNGDGDFASVYSYDKANFNLRNARIINKNSDSAAKSIILIAHITTGDKPNATLNNIKLISTGAIIYFNGNININNYGLFGNKNITTNINLQIGTFTNKVFVYDPNLT